MRLYISALFLLAVVLPISCGKLGPADGKLETYTISSDLETVVQEGQKNLFASNIEGVFFQNGDFASTDFALSGKQSIKLDENQVYGLNINIDDLQEGQFVRASIWQKEGGSDGTLIATVKGADYSHSFRTYYDVKSQTEKGWVQHYLTFVVTKGVENVSFYIFSGKKLAYFDDIKVEVLAKAPKNKLSKRLEVVFPEASKHKLNGYINDALKSEIIASKNKKYVKAKILTDGDSSSIKIKLKGDWTDHLKSGKTSYRIKMRGDAAFDGLVSFSIQHPKTRNYLHEWVIHKIADGIDLLATEYDF
ncbi:MAG: hypothetical protein R3279_12965, partial [Putridiphycobacter sp.]|nr:hypothetical protein [Putridiphycobacter sp.]